MKKMFSGFIVESDDGIRLSDSYASLASRVSELAELSSVNEDTSENGNFSYMGGVSGRIENCSFSFYTSNNECTLEEVQMGFLNSLYGDLDIYGENYGYSEYTIMGLDLFNFTIGNHNIEDILESQLGKYINIIIEW